MSEHLKRIRAIASQENVFWNISNPDDRRPYDPNLEIASLPSEARIYVDILALISVLNQANTFDNVKRTFGDYIKCPGAQFGVVLFSNDKTSDVIYPNHADELGRVPVFECIIGADYFKTPQFLIDHPEILTVLGAQEFIIGLLQQWTRSAELEFEEFKLPKTQSPLE